MALLLGSAAILLFLALFFFRRAVLCTKRRRMVRACGSGLGGIGAIAVALPVLILIFSYYSFARLTGEQRVATVEFRRIAPNEYQARVMTPGEIDRFFNLRGDEWQIDARLVTWQAPATILGLDPIYQLERISGRYAEIDREQNEFRTVYALSTDYPIDVWKLARMFPLLMPGIDAYYGTATYVPMADGAQFDINLSRDALLARPANDVARDAVGKWSSSAR